jgi:hypothetical protein
MITLRLYILIGIVIIISCTVAQSQTFENEDKYKLAVLRIGFEDFADAEKILVNQAFYEHFNKDKRFSVITEEDVRSKLLPLGIEPFEITDITGYIHAGQILAVDYLLVGNMDKIGNFVEVAFRVFTMPKGTQKQYPGGKTFDILIRDEIPNIIDSIYNDMRLEKPRTGEEGRITLPGATPEDETKKKRNKSWMWFVIGGAASGVTAALLLSGGGNGATPNEALPRPPIVP